MDADEGLGPVGVVVGGELVDEVIPAAGGEELGAVVEASGICRVHDVQSVSYWMANGTYPPRLLTFLGASPRRGG